MTPDKPHETWCSTRQASNISLPCDCRGTTTTIPNGDAADLPPRLQKVMQRAEKAEVERDALKAELTKAQTCGICGVTLPNNSNGSLPCICCHTLREGELGAEVERLKAELETLKLELKAAEDTSGITNITEQFQQQLDVMQAELAEARKVIAAYEAEMNPQDAQEARAAIGAARKEAG